MRIDSSSQTRSRSNWNLKKKSKEYSEQYPPCLGFLFSTVKPAQVNLREKAGKFTYPECISASHTVYRKACETNWKPHVLAVALQVSLPANSYTAGKPHVKAKYMGTADKFAFLMYNYRSVSCKRGIFKLNHSQTSVKMSVDLKVPCLKIVYRTTCEKNFLWSLFWAASTDVLGPQATQTCYSLCWPTTWSSTVARLPASTTGPLNRNLTVAKSKRWTGRKFSYLFYVWYSSWAFSNQMICWGLLFGFWSDYSIVLIVATRLSHFFRTKFFRNGIV